MLSEAAQDYIKQIYTLQARGGKAITSALAETLGVSPASATAMLKKLTGLGWSSIGGTMTPC
ncbi:MAG: metal-dependent transcriptional regulator [Gaiellales bacterium]